MTFHWQNGWYFTRFADGGVEVRNHGDFQKHDPNCAPGDGRTTLIIDPSAWGSIVASVSKGGETSERYRAACEFHASEGDAVAPEVELIEILGGALAQARQAHAVPNGGPAFDAATNLASTFDLALGRYMDWRIRTGRQSEAEKRSGFVDVPEHKR